MQHRKQSHVKQVFCTQIDQETCRNVLITNTESMLTSAKHLAFSHCARIEIRLSEKGNVI